MAYELYLNNDGKDQRRSPKSLLKHKTKTCPQGDLGLIGELNMGTDSHHVY